MTTTTQPDTPHRTGARGAMAVLSSVQENRRAADAAEAQVLVDAVEWAAMNPPVLGRDAAVWEHRPTQGARPHRAPLSAEGVPEVDKAAVAELGLALGWSTQAAQALVADGLELAHRLPMLWTRVIAGEVKAWRARQIAQSTCVLARIAAGYVDRQVAPVAHRVTRPQVERLVQTAIARFDPEQVEAADAARDDRSFEIHLDRTTLGGLTPVDGLLDLPDALDVEAAVAHAATQLAAWGSEDPVAVRRARALGDLARAHLTWHGEDMPSAAGVVQLGTNGPIVTTQDVPTERTRGHGHGERHPEETGDLTPRFRVPPRRRVVLYVHLTDTALALGLDRAGDETGGRVPTRGGGLIGRAENTGSPVTAETIRSWCGEPATSLSVRPVLDLDGYQQADAYEIPARVKEQIRLRDGTCVFPGCHAPGLRAQVDHTDPFDHSHPDQGGQTETTNLALLCQRHHNLKTHHGFVYTVLPGGGVLWRTPHGLTVHRHRDGRVDVDLPSPRPADLGPFGRERPAATDVDHITAPPEY